MKGGGAGGVYLWQTRAAAEAFYTGPWLDGIREPTLCAHEPGGPRGLPGGHPVLSVPVISTRPSGRVC